MKHAILAFFLFSISILGSTPLYAQTPEPPAPLKQMENEGAQLQYLGADRGVDGWIVLIPNGKEEIPVASAPEQQPAAAADTAQVPTANEAAVNDSPEAQLKALQDSLNSLPQDSVTIPPVVMPQPTQEEAPLVQNTQQTVPIKSSPAAEKLWNALEKTSWVAWGDSGAPYIYAYIDPQCPFSRKFLAEAKEKKWAAGKRVQIRLIPVAYANKNSRPLAAELLNTKDVDGWLDKMIQGTQKSDPAFRVTKADKKKIEQNFSTAGEYRIDATPFVIYKAKSGEMKIIRGKPDTLYTIEADLL